MRSCEKVQDWDGPESQSGGVLTTLQATACHSMEQHSVRVCIEENRPHQG